MLFDLEFQQLFIILITIICLYFVVPTARFQQQIYTVNENEELQSELVLTGLASIDFTVHILTTDGSATGKC